MKHWRDDPNHITPWGQQISSHRGIEFFTSGPYLGSGSGGSAPEKQHPTKEQTMNDNAHKALRIRDAMNILRPSWILWILAGACFVVARLKIGFLTVLVNDPDYYWSRISNIQPALITLGILLAISAVLIAVQRLAFNFRLGPLYDEIDQLRSERRENAYQIGGLKSKVDYAQLNLKTRTDQLDEAHAAIRRLKLRARNVKPKKRQGA